MLCPVYGCSIPKYDLGRLFYGLVIAFIVFTWKHTSLISRLTAYFTFISYWFVFSFLSYERVCGCYDWVGSGKILTVDQSTMTTEDFRLDYIARYATWSSLVEDWWDVYGYVIGGRIYKLFFDSSYGRSKGKIMYSMLY